MRAVQLVGAMDARFVEAPEPVLRPGTVKVQVGFVGICGSDLGLYEHPQFFDAYRHPIFQAAPPFTLGHELSGTVVEVAPDVTGVIPGTRAAIRPNVWDGTCGACLRGETNLCEQWGFIGVQADGGLGEYVVVNADQVHRLPDCVSLEAGALVESTAVAWHAVKLGEVVAGSSVLVVGAGPVGLGILLSAKARGTHHVIVSEPSSSRRNLARELGADAIDPAEVEVAEYVRTVTAGAGVDVAFDAAGAGDATFQPALRSLRAGGRLVLVAAYHSGVKLSLEPNDLLYSERIITASFAYTDDDFAEVVAEVTAGRIDPLPLVSSTVPLEHAVARGLDHLIEGGRDSEVKVLVGL